MNAHSGYVAIVGRPNVGKSTLLNRLIGQKLSITSDKPQTTRHRLLGIKNLEQHQIVYVDTPGIHLNARRALNRAMNRAAGSALYDVNLIIFMVEAMRWNDEDEHVLKLVQKTGIATILAVNKIDRLKERNELFPYTETLTEKFQFADIFPLSAKKGENLEALENRLVELLPENLPLFPEDQLTDRSERFIAAELIREKLMRRLGDEIPYRLNVSIELFEESSKITKIDAVIWVERSGQKAIVIGKQGQALKAIGTQARIDLEKLLERKVFLQLWVKVKEGWSDDERLLRRFGYE
ncbi:MAG: GTPase Era [Pseudomonadota bacterium]